MAPTVIMRLDDRLEVVDKDALVKEFARFYDHNLPHIVPSESVRPEELQVFCYGIEHHQHCPRGTWRTAEEIYELAVELAKRKRASHVEVHMTVVYAPKEKSDEIIVKTKYYQRKQVA